MKQLGVGLAVGVALAAMTVLLLARALLVLAGAASWWMPAWLNRVFPHVDIEGASAGRGPLRRKQLRLRFAVDIGELTVHRATTTPTAPRPL
jgi:hypothetical protein